MMGFWSFLASSFWNGLLGYLSWMWAFGLGSLAGLAIWFTGASLALLSMALVLGWLAGAFREAWVIRSRMLRPGA